MPRRRKVVNLRVPATTAFRRRRADIRASGARYGDASSTTASTCFISAANAVLMGANGPADTLLRMGRGLEPGRRERAARRQRQARYFAQQSLDLLDPTRTVFGAVPPTFPMPVHACCGRVGASSSPAVSTALRCCRGRTSRLVLARMRFDPPIPVLNEPTNPLDLETKLMLVSPWSIHRPMIFGRTTDVPEGRHPRSRARRATARRSRRSAALYPGSYTESWNALGTKPPGARLIAGTGGTVLDVESSIFVRTCVRTFRGRNLDCAVLRRRGPDDERSGRDDGSDLCGGGAETRHGRAGAAGGSSTCCSGIRHSVRGSPFGGGRSIRAPSRHRRALACVEAAFAIVTRRRVSGRRRWARGAAFAFIGWNVVLGLRRSSGRRPTLVPSGNHPGRVAWSLGRPDRASR